MPGWTCPVGWFVYTNKCYFVDTGPDVAFGACQTMCSAKNSRMLCIENDEQNLFYSRNPVSTTNYVWLSFNKFTTGANFVWEDGCPFSYAPCQTGGPDNAGGIENCAVLVLSVKAF